MVFVGESFTSSKDRRDISSSSYSLAEMKPLWRHAGRYKEKTTKRNLLQNPLHRFCGKKTP